MPFSLCSVTSTPVGDVVGHQRRDPDAEVDIEAVAQLLGGAGRHLVAGPGHGSFSFRSGRALADGALLDPLLVVLPLDDAVDEDAGRVDVVGVERAVRHQLFDLGDA